MKSKLTIVTTTYNQEKYIADAMDGFVKQKTNFPFEVIISDDGSTDDTIKIIKKYAKKYPDIIKPIFNTTNKGPMLNFVETLNVADSEYVALCDGDDYWCDYNKLQEQVDFLDSHPDYSICFHQAKIFFENNEKTDEIYPSNKLAKSTDFNDLLRQNYIPANTIVYRWRFNKKNKLIDNFPKNIVPGDYYISLLHAHVGKIHFIDKVMSCYRRHDAGMWWLSSQESMKDEFTMKYGLKYFNFFKSVEDNFKLDKKTYKVQKDYLAMDLIKLYLSKGMIDELYIAREYDKELFDSCIKSLCNQGSLFDGLSRSKKIMYSIFIEPSIIKNKIVKKAEKNKITNFFYRSLKFLRRKIKGIKVDNIYGVK